MEYFEPLKAAKAIDDHRVEVTFKNGRIGIFDCRPYFDVGYYRPLRDPEFFKLAHVALGDLAWPNDIDIGSDDVWDETIPKARPKARRTRTPAKREPARA